MPLFTLKDSDRIISETREALLQTIGVSSKNCDEASKHCKVYGDAPSQMTGGRLLARFFSQFRWYYCPSQNTACGADLDQAWAHYEHITLPRVYTDDPDDAFCRATPGDKDRPTRLYPLWSTPTKELGDFGISVRMYFSSLFILAVFLGVAGILNLPLSVYFWKESYSSHYKQDFVLMVQASAVCTETAWVDCGDSCREQQDHFLDRFSAENSDLVLKNDCNFEDWLWPGILSYCASILLIVQFGIAFFWLQRRAEIVFDEEIQTASDYSVKISNPPPDAVHPEEWKDYLQTFGPVIACTVAIDNAGLLDKLVKRRKFLKKLSLNLPIDCDVRNPQALASALSLVDSSPWSLPFVSTPHSLYKKLQKLEDEIRELHKLHYKAVAVYCTFETERAQRNALHTLSTGKFSVWQNTPDLGKFDEYNRMYVDETAKSSRLPECKCNAELVQVLTEDEDIDTLAIQVPVPDKKSLTDTLLFRGTHVVSIKEACEPNDVRWMDLQVPFTVRFIRFFGSTVAVIWFMFWSGLFIHGLQKNHPGTFFTPLFITVTNVLVPKLCEFINKLEAHSTEQSRQGSLYIKVALFRWFNSAIALTIVIGFTQTITHDPENNSDTLNQAVYNLIFAELFTVPLIKLIDIMGFVRKHILAPRARNQEEMNSYMSGGRFELAERYTDATKVLFVSLFYSQILPVSLFLGAAALLTHFLVGKFCLLRMWRTAPDIGPGLSRLSRNYFFSTCLLVHVIMSAYWWSGYPYDDLCQNENGEYFFCDQDFLRGWVFPPLPRFQPVGSEWMTQSQATITSLFSWTALVMVTVAAVVFVKEILFPFVGSFFTSNYEPDGKDQGITFSSVLHLYEVHGYIPQLRDTAFPYPLLACDVSETNENLLGWKDPNGYQHHSLFADAQEIMGCKTEHVVFSQTKYWSSDTRSD